MKFLLLLVSLATGQIFFGFDHREFGVDSRRIRDAEGSGEDPGESQVDSCCYDYSNEKPIYIFDAESTTSPSSPLIAYLSCLCEEYIFSVKFRATATGLILALAYGDEMLFEISQSGASYISVSTGSSYGISQSSSSVIFGDELAIEVFLEINAAGDPELNIYVDGTRIIKLETVEIKYFQNIQIVTSASSPVTFTEIKLQNAHNDEVAGRNDQAENRFCSEDYPLRGESCSSCDGIWDEVNVLCGELGDHWVGSQLSGYCTDCSNTEISCYCICTEDYIETWVNADQPECTLNTVYCQECSVISIQQSSTPPSCDKPEDCLSPTGVCFESVSAYEVNVDGERRNVISLVYGCATQESPDLQDYFPREESAVITQSKGVIQTSVYYTDPNSLNSEEHILASLEKNGEKDPLSCYECKVEYSLEVDDPCVTPRDDETATRRCVLGSCEAKILAIESSGRTFYFAERGCTADPASSVLPDTPSQLFGASSYWPELPFVGVNVYISTSIENLGNDDTSYVLQAAELFTCYKCQGMIINENEPSFGDDFFNNDIDNCWKPSLLTELDTCATECFTQFYAVTVDGIYQVEIARGCVEADPDLSVVYHGVDIINEICTKDDGSLCNEKTPIEIGLIYQNTEILECYTCDTGLVSRDPLSSCFTASNVPILSCPDSSYTKCRQETSVFQIEGITYYYGKRGCGSLVSSGFVDIDGNQFDLGGLEFECDERICNNIPGKYTVPEPVNLTISENAQMLDVKYTRFNTVMETVLENVKQATERFNENCYSLFTVYAVQQKSEIVSCEVYNVAEVEDRVNLRKSESKQYYIDFGIRTRGEFVVVAENVVELKDSKLETVAVMAKTSYAGLSVLFPIWCALLGCIFILLAYHYHPQQPVKFAFRVILPVLSFQPSAVIWFQYQTGFGNVLKISPSSTVTFLLAFVITLRLISNFMRIACWLNKVPLIVQDWFKEYDTWMNSLSVIEVTLVYFSCNRYVLPGNGVFVSILLTILILFAQALYFISNHFIRRYMKKDNSRPGTAFSHSSGAFSPKIKIVQIIRHVFWIIMLLLVLSLTLGFAYCAPTYSSFYDNKKSYIDDELNIMPLSGPVINESDDVPGSCSIFPDSVFLTNSLFSSCIKADVYYNDDVISATMFADPLNITCLSTAEILLLCLIALLITLNIAISFMAAKSRSYFSKSVRVITPFCDTEDDMNYNNRSWWLSRPQTAISRSLRPWTARTIGTIPERPWTAESSTIQDEPNTFDLSQFNPRPFTAVPSNARRNIFTRISHRLQSLSARSRITPDPQ